MASKAEGTERYAATTDRVTVAGIVLIEGTEQGIQGLSVDILHTERSSKRLGSTVTDSNGRFNVTFSADNINKSANQSLNIQLIILIPERPGLTRADRIIFESEVRENAALNEVFMVEITSDILASKGLQRVVNNARPLVERKTEALLESARVSEIVSETANKLAMAEIKKVEQQRRFLNDVVVPSVREEISNVTERERRSPHFVADDDQIQSSAIQVHFNEIVKLREMEEDESVQTARKVKRQTRIQISDEVFEQLKAITQDNDVDTITQTQLEAELGTPLGKPALIQRPVTISDPCREKLPGENCLDSSVNHTSEVENDQVTEDVNGQNVTFDAGTAIAALMETQTTPEQTVMFDDINGQLENRLNASEVATAIGSITLQPGPADVPSFHDFTTLQLAFEPVWQEAIDDRILDDIEAAYDRIVESGLDTGDVDTWDLYTITLMYTAYAATIKEVPQVIASHIRISLEEYRMLPTTTRTHLNTLATKIDQKRDELIEALSRPPPEESTSRNWWEHLTSVNFLINILGNSTRGTQYDLTAISLIEQIRILEAEADRIISHARQIIIDRERNQPFRPTHEVIQRLRSARSRGYPFRYFAASRSQRSVNFGIMITYRQRWTPVSYQVGDLVSTIPLGPKEIRKYSKKEVQKRRRSEKELESNLSNSKFDSETKSRAEAEILAKASGKTSFEDNAKDSFNYGVKGSMSIGSESVSTFRDNAEHYSQDIKKNLRESVVKAAKERRQETKLEVEAEEWFESEFAESGELINPNDEIPVTFLLYELQRRYRIHEKLHQLQSVVLVAQEMPRASQIDATWIIQHDWILNRVVLDDSFRPALMYVTTTLVSEREALRHMRQALLDQQALVEQIKEDLADRRSMEGLRYAALERQIERMARENRNDESLWDTISDVVSEGGLLGGILGGGDTGEDNAAKIRESAARDAWDRERREADTFRNRLMDAQSTLATMREEFHNRLSAHLSQVTLVERLTTHIYQNIMYYMQAIWSHEPDDQRFLRLRDVPVPTLETQHSFRISDDLLPEQDPDSIVGFETEYGTATIPAQPEDIPTVPLAQVADLSNPLGFMGNYMIFPMYETNALTDFMMAPYVEYAAGEYNVSDPDLAGNISLEEFSDYVCCLKNELPAERFEVLQPELGARLKYLLQQSIRDNEEIIVGTGNLYIECLPGAHSILEQFKHLHRQIDVKVAQEELRTQAIDNVRRAQRILDSDLEDPDIEAKYVFEGDGSATVIAPGSQPNSGLQPNSDPGSSQ